MTIILGETAHAQLGLDPVFGSDYDPDSNPDLTTEFMTAGFRYGHTLLPEEIVYTNTSFTEFHSKLLRSVSTVIYPTPPPPL